MIPHFDPDELETWLVRQVAVRKRALRHRSEQRDRHKRYWKIRNGEQLRNFVYWRKAWYKHYSRRYESTGLNRIVRRDVKAALRQQIEFDVREFERRLPYD